MTVTELSEQEKMKREVEWHASDSGAQRRSVQIFGWGRWTGRWKDGVLNERTNEWMNGKDGTGFVGYRCVPHHHTMSRSAEVESLKQDACVRVRVRVRVGARVRTQIITEDELATSIYQHISPPHIPSHKNSFCSCLLTLLLPYLQPYSPSRLRKPSEPLSPFAFESKVSLAHSLTHTYTYIHSHVHIQ